MHGVCGQRRRVGRKFAYAFKLHRGETPRRYRERHKRSA